MLACARLTSTVPPDFFTVATAIASIFLLIYFFLMGFMERHPSTILLYCLSLSSVTFLRSSLDLLVAHPPEENDNNFCSLSLFFAHAVIETLVWMQPTHTDLNSGKNMTGFHFQCTSI